MMTENKHTPGPWFYITGQTNAMTGEIVDIVEDESGLNICEVYGCNPGDGYLIAVAPQLLAKLKLIDSRVDDRFLPDMPDEAMVPAWLRKSEVMALRALIAQARQLAKGETN